MASWLLGAVTATAGSLYAVDQLGQGLLAQHTNRVSVAMVNRELAQVNSEHPAPAASFSPSRSAAPSPSVRAARTAPGKRPPEHANASPSKLLSTAGGTAVADCRPGGAYLVYVSPGQGYDFDELRRGPAPMASVTFENSSGAVELRVTCTSSGRLVKHVSTLGSDDGSHNDG